MFELFRKIFYGFYSAYLSMIIVVLVLILPGAALVNLCNVVLERRSDELGMAFMQVVAACVIVAFLYWVQRDVTRRANRLKPRRPKRQTEVGQANDNDEDSDADLKSVSQPPSSDQIQPWPRG